MLSAVWVIAEHPFRVVKRQFGLVEVCYRGLAKNTGQIIMLFALANLWLARKQIVVSNRRVTLVRWKIRVKIPFSSGKLLKIACFHVFYGSLR